MNFNIVDGSDDWMDLLPKFAKLYNDNTVMATEIPSMMNITVGVYRRLRKEAKSRGLIDYRYAESEKKGSYGKNPQYICRNGYKYQVRRKINGETYFGSYRNREDALKVVELLKECDWDKSQLDRIKKEVLDGKKI